LQPCFLPLSRSTLLPCHYCCAYHPLPAWMPCSLLFLLGSLQAPFLFCLAPWTCLLLRTATYMSSVFCEAAVGGTASFTTYTFTSHYAPVDFIGGFLLFPSIPYACPTSLSTACLTTVNALGLHLRAQLRCGLAFYHEDTAHTTLYSP